MSSDIPLLFSLYHSWLLSADILRCSAHFLTTLRKCHWKAKAANLNGPRTIDWNTVNKKPFHGDIPEQIKVSNQLSSP